MELRDTRTGDYPEDRRRVLGDAIKQARRAAGHRWRPSFAQEAGISKRSLEAVELNDASVGESALQDIGRALGRHFSAWNAKTPQRILEGNDPPDLEVSPPADDVNAEMLAELHETYAIYTVSRQPFDKAARALELVWRAYKKDEPDRGRRMRTWQRFLEEIVPGLTEREDVTRLRKVATPLE